MRTPAAAALNYTNGLLKSVVSIDGIPFRLLSAESAIEIFHSAPSDKAARSFPGKPFCALLFYCSPLNTANNIADIMCNVAESI